MGVMKKTALWRRIVGGEDLLEPTRRRWMLLCVGLVSMGVTGFLLGLALPDPDELRSRND